MVQFDLRISGQFELEIILVRSSESLTALIKSLNTVNGKYRNFRGYFENLKFTQRCGFVIPSMLDINSMDSTQICPIETSPGRAWFCEKPENSTVCPENFVWQGGAYNNDADLKTTRPT